MVSTLRFLFHLFAIVVCACAVRWANGQELSADVRGILMDRCSGCHDQTESSGGIDLVGLMKDFSPIANVAAWEKVDIAIATSKMPPEDDQPLKSREKKLVADWFQQQFVKPGGVQHAGQVLPRRLTREELQNTLEDILHVDIRAEVTNSRLHVIPDTIIEKFFSTGVIGESGFSNDAATLSKESIDIQTYARCFSLVLSLLDSNAMARQRLFGTDVLPLKLSAAQAEIAIKNFGRAAFGREMSSAEFNAIDSLYQSNRDNPFQAMKSAMLATLLSPPFLYRLEQPCSGQSLVSENELAVRLAYFLWSAPPDDELWNLASASKLHDPKMLAAQVRRMLADPKRIALSENLGGEWFDYKKLRQQSSVDKRSDRMSGFYRTQYEEALLMFDSLLRYDQPLFRIVDADWAFLNRHQAGIYGLSLNQKKLKSPRELPPISIHFRSTDRQVYQGTYEYKHAPLGIHKTNDPDRIGFLTSGPTLTATSTENRTSPIRRGVWVMERILGKHFVVPKDVPDLALTQAKAKKEKLDLDPTEILKLHSSQQGCAACHQFIDPIGFALELFDQRGVRRKSPEPVPEGGEKLNWDPTMIKGSYADHTWQIKQPISPDGLTRVFFNYTKGRHRLDIRKVRLRSGDVELVDKHFGYTGGKRRDNVWKFQIPADAPTTSWQLTAEVKGDGGSDSRGIITIVGPDTPPSQLPSYKLPGGKSFRSPSELKELLLSDYREQVIDNVVRRVLAYSLGRKLLPIDRPAIRKIKQQLVQEDYRMTALIEAVVLSYPFRHKEFE